MIEVRFSNESVVELQGEMRQLLNGEGAAAIGYGGAGTTAQIAEKVAQANKPASGRTRDKNKADAAPAATQNISTGEERVDPAVDAQDAADEKADTAATKPVDLTHDDVKKLLGGYVMAYGMEAAQADGTGFIGAPKISEIPDTQAALAKAIIGIAKGINGNPNKRELNGDGLSAEKTAELKVIVTAAMAVK